MCILSMLDLEKLLVCVYTYHLYIFSVYGVQDNFDRYPRKVRIA